MSKIRYYKDFKEGRLFIETERKAEGGRQGVRITVFVDQSAEFTEFYTSREISKLGGVRAIRERILGACGNSIPSNIKVHVLNAIQNKDLFEKGA